MKTLEVTWWRATRIWWSMFWRSMLYVFLISLPLGLIIGLLASSLNINRVPEIYLQLLSGIIGIPVWIWVIKIVFEKQFSDFQVVLTEPLESLLDDSEDEN